MRPERVIARALAVLVFATALAFVSTSGARPGGGDAHVSPQRTFAACPQHPSGTICPVEVAPPVISGAALVGNTLAGRPGTWQGTQPISYKFQWLRCQADSGDDTSTSSCVSISGATTTLYTVTSSDLGLRLRFRVQATNKVGSTTSTSAATSVVAVEGGEPASASPPTISGSAVVGSTLTSETGTWVGDQPITYSYRWLRCDREGNACKSTGKTAKTYKVVQADSGRRLRVGVIATNSFGSGDAFSTPTDAVVSSGADGTINLPGGGKSIAAKNVPKAQRLVVDAVLFDPNPVTSRDRPITVSIRVTATGRGYAVRDAVVFIRSTPLLTSGGDNKLTAADGWVTYSLQPESDFPLKDGYNVQFFVKAYRKGDPSLGGIYGSRLVQVATKSP
jgi:hypothetical protein